jgi:CSLREA domain-containing protein
VVAVPVGAPAARGAEAVPPVIDLTAYEGNPVVEPGPEGDWDELVLGAYAVYTDGVTYLFYTGWIDWGYGPWAIGYVTSTNGITFTRSAANPILEGDGSGFDSWSVGVPVVLLEGNTWTMYYAGDDYTPHIDGEAVGMATASDPAGPWDRLNDPVLHTGSDGEWDDSLISPTSVVAANGVYTMYYTAGSDDRPGLLTGMATSSNGVDWIKYDDPATTLPPYAESDPVLMPGHLGDWDENGAYATRVRKMDDGWEMFYTGDSPTVLPSIGYAWSADGIEWVKHPDNPIYTPADDPSTTLIEGPTVLVHGSTYWMYYDYHVDNGIGLATGTVEWPPIVVDTTDDELNADGDCSLREAIQAANTDAAVDACPAGFGHDTVIVPAGTYTLTIPRAYEDYNQTGDLDIRGDLTLQGDGAEATIIDGNALDRVIHNHGWNVEVGDLTITNGEALSGSEDCATMPGR